MLYAPDAEVRALRAARPWDEPDVTFINFGAGERYAAGAHRAVPGSGEQPVRIALAQAMRTLAPVTANVPGESFRAWLYSGFFAVLWLVSGGLFRAASSTDRQALD